MKFSDLKKKLSSPAISPEQSALAVQEIEEKYLPEIHGGTDEDSSSGGVEFQAFAKWGKSF